MAEPFRDEEKNLLRPYLWDADLDRLDPTRDAWVVIERLLEFGGDREIAFLFARYPRGEIARVVMESRGLSPRTVNYWAICFHLNRGKTQCFTRPSPMVWQPF